MIFILMNGCIKELKRSFIMLKFVNFSILFNRGKVQNVGFKTEFKFFSVSKTIIQKINKSRID